MATIETQNCYVLTLSEDEMQALWFHLKYGTIDEEDLDAPYKADELHEEIYQAVRNILNKD